MTPKAKTFKEEQKEKPGIHFSKTQNENRKLEKRQE